MFVVSKRNGDIVDFNIQKIKDAIDKGDSSEAIQDLSKIIDYYSRI